jgi:PKHD-type hydroxylase
VLALPEVLTDEELIYVREALKAADFVDGKLTAQGLAKDAKKNEQLKRDGDSALELDAVLVTALLRHELFSAWALPLTVSAPLVNRHAIGMSYGFHVDAPISPPPHLMRRDLSVTLFLDDPETYEGGELEVESPGGMKRVKLKAGDAFVYQTHALHQVCEVSRGIRHAAVFWIQSQIPDDSLRQHLFDLRAATSSLHARGVVGQEMLLLNKVHQNLTRKFVRT